MAKVAREGKIGSDSRFGHGWYGMGTGMMGFGLPDGGYLERALFLGKRDWAEINNIYTKILDLQQ